MVNIIWYNSWVNNNIRCIVDCDYIRIVVVVVVDIIIVVKIIVVVEIVVAAWVVGRGLLLRRLWLVVGWSLLLIHQATKSKLKTNYEIFMIFCENFHLL